jgi:large subunit ribosomal protein L25
VVYGRGSEARPLTVARRDLRQVLTGDAGMNAVINLDVEGDTLLAIVRDVQRDPVRNNVTHVDFILVSRDEAVSVEVPIVLEGEATEVLRHDGTVDQQMFTLTVQAKPGSIPNELSLDISGLDVGDTLRVSDLSLPTGAAPRLDPRRPSSWPPSNAAAAEVDALDAEVAEEAAAEAAEEAAEEAARKAGAEAEAAADGDAPAAGDAEG